MGCEELFLRSWVALLLAATQAEVDDVVAVLLSTDLRPELTAVLGSLGFTERDSGMASS